MHVVKPIQELDNGALLQVIEDKAQNLTDHYPYGSEAATHGQQILGVVALLAARQSFQEVMSRKD